jgi:hypothetical protein
MPESMWLRKAHVGKDRRNDIRVPCDGTTVIDVLSPQPQSSVQARVIEVSASGLKLSLPIFLSPGALIRIKMTNAVADAEVRCCTCEGSEYHIGVTVEEVVPKSA